ncbi:peroxisomal membrane protein PMP22-like isoform X5 [Camellia sinensis]|uniref:peroxisomal membrane protein PMP22-like isoform X5 n=1 Tax=Camellia sinensis TaxID=4442 RepID=UPI001036D560|nr:peroxisomal membrane protein PMP22-like isoform X5 [Camellia sinensis]
MSEVVKKAWNIYMLQLQLHPLRTKVITSGVLAGFQDLYSQKSSGIKKLQLRRLLLLMVLLQQLTYHPWNNLIYMVYYGLVVEGRPWRSVKNKVRKEYPALQLDAWKVRVMFSTVYGSCCPNPPPTRLSNGSFVHFRKF